MRLPPGLVLLLAGLVTAFGVFRISLAFRKERGEGERRGLFGYPRRTQILMGTIYVLLGILLALPALGIRFALFGQ